MKQFLSALERGETSAGTYVLENISSEAKERVRLASRVEWLPIEIMYEATAVLTEIIGPEKSEEFFRQMWKSVLDAPIFRSLISGIRSLGARSPAAYLKHTPRGYALVFREVGSMSVSERTEFTMVLEFHDLPKRCFDPLVQWARYTAAIYSNAFEFTQTQGETRVLREDPASGYARISFEW